MSVILDQLIEPIEIDQLDEPDEINFSKSFTTPDEFRPHLFNAEELNLSGDFSGLGLENFVSDLSFVSISNKEIMSKLLDLLRESKNFNCTLPKFIDNMDQMTDENLDKLMIMYEYVDILIFRAFQQKDYLMLTKHIAELQNVTHDLSLKEKFSSIRIIFYISYYCVILCKKIGHPITKFIDAMTSKLHEFSADSRGVDVFTHYEYQTHIEHYEALKKVNTKSELDNFFNQA
jgi:hypothetical protein